MNPSTNDECGFLLDGFDSPPMIMMTYTPPYYLDYMEQCGLRKAVTSSTFRMRSRPEIGSRNCHKG